MYTVSCESKVAFTHAEKVWWDTWVTSSNLLIHLENIKKHEMLVLHSQQLVHLFSYIRSTGYSSRKHFATYQWHCFPLGVHTHHLTRGCLLWHFAVKTKQPWKSSVVPAAVTYEMWWKDRTCRIKCKSECVGGFFYFKNKIWTLHICWHLN